MCRGGLNIAFLQEFLITLFFRLSLSLNFDEENEKRHLFSSRHQIQDTSSKEFRARIARRTGFEFQTRFIHTIPSVIRST